MAKYDRKAAEKIGQVMREFRDGELTSGPSGLPVRSRKQAIAIGLSEARASGSFVPPLGRKRLGAY